MKCSITRLLGVAAIYLLIHLGIAACSGSQGDEEGLDAENQGEEGNGEEGNGEEGNGEEASNENGAIEGNNIPEGNAVTEEPTNATPVNGASGDGELQEIISAMNTQDESGAAPTTNATAAPAVDAAAVTSTAPATDAAAAAAAVTSAPSTPAGTGLPEMGSKMPYIVKKGDTLGTIAAKIYGDLNKYTEIASLTSLKNPSKIYPGDVVYYQLSQQTMAFASAYENAARKEVTVQQGDTLATISKRVFGTSQEWKSIWRQNGTVDNPDRLTVGQTIYYVDYNGIASNLIKNVNSNVVSTIRSSDNLSSIDFNKIEKNNVKVFQDHGTKVANTFFATYSAVS